MHFQLRTLWFSLEFIHYWMVIRKWSEFVIQINCAGYRCELFKSTKNKLIIKFLFNIPCNVFFSSILFSDAEHWKKSECASLLKPIYTNSDPIIYSGNRSSNFITRNIALSKKKQTEFTYIRSPRERFRARIFNKFVWSCINLSFVFVFGASNAFCVLAVMQCWKLKSFAEKNIIKWNEKNHKQSTYTQFFFVWKKQNSFAFIPSIYNTHASVNVKRRRSRE